ncbi:hypothetical protein AB7M49_003888 [Bradyrhizobium elkanii]
MESELDDSDFLVHPKSVLRQPVVSQAVYPDRLRIIDCIGDGT